MLAKKKPEKEKDKKKDKKEKQKSLDRAEVDSKELTDNTQDEEQLKRKTMVKRLDELLNDIIHLEHSNILVIVDLYSLEILAQKKPGKDKDKKKDKKEKGKSLDRAEVDTKESIDNTQDEKQLKSKIVVKKMK